MSAGNAVAEPWVQSLLRIPDPTQLSTPSNASVRAPPGECSRKYCFQAKPKLNEIGFIFSFCYFVIMYSYVPVTCAFYVFTCFINVVMNPDDGEVVKFYYIMPNGASHMIVL